MLKRLEMEMLKPVTDAASKQSGKGGGTNNIVAQIMESAPKAFHESLEQRKELSAASAGSSSQPASSASQPASGPEQPVDKPAQETAPVQSSEPSPVEPPKAAATAKERRSAKLAKGKGKGKRTKAAHAEQRQLGTRPSMPAKLASRPRDRSADLKAELQQLRRDQQPAAAAAPVRPTQVQPAAPAGPKAVQSLLEEWRATHGGRGANTKSRGRRAAA